VRNSRKAHGTTAQNQGPCLLNTPDRQPHHRESWACRGAPMRYGAAVPERIGDT